MVECVGYATPTTVITGHKFGTERRQSVCSVPDVCTDQAIPFAKTMTDSQLQMAKTLCEAKDSRHRLENPVRHQPVLDLANQQLQNKCSRFEPSTPEISADAFKVFSPTLRQETCLPASNASQLPIESEGAVCWFSKRRRRLVPVEAQHTNAPGSRGHPGRTA